MLTEDPWDLDYFLENDLDLYVSQVVDPCTAIWCDAVECLYAGVAAPTTARLPDQLTSVLFHWGSTGLHARPRVVVSWRALVAEVSDAI